MQTVLLVIHLFACIALVIAVMLQRSEGGALGMGGGGTGGLISGRGAANVLVRTTMILAAVFFTTSIVMTRINAENSRQPSALERQLQQQTTDPLGTSRDPLAPSTSAPASPAPATPDPLAPANPSTATTPQPATPAPTTSTPAPATPDPLAPAQNNSGNNN